MNLSLGEITRTALSEIWGHKLRTLLTLLGIMLGTFSITVMTSILSGITDAVWQGFADLGFDGVMYVVNRPPRDLAEQAIFTRSRGLQPEDADVLLDRARVIDSVAPALFTDAMVRAGDVERRVRVMGVTSGYNVVRGRTLESGRFFSDLEESGDAHVCVLGYRLNRRLFGTESGVGRQVFVDARPMRVIGVGKKLGNRFVNDDEFIEEMEGLYVPLPTLRAFTTGPDQPLSFIAVKTGNPDKLSDLRAEATASLQLAHRGAGDFKIQNIAQEMLKVRKEIKTVLGNWYIVLGTIASIALLVGGIGLLSVMLISIGERLYEIGLRKAIGATNTQIFLQFIAESALLSFIGGIVGVGLGVGLNMLVSGFFTGGLPIHILGILAALGISILLGILYGLYPALRAARMEPVEALRSVA